MEELKHERISDQSLYKLRVKINKLTGSGNKVVLVRTFVTKFKGNQKKHRADKFERRYKAEVLVNDIRKVWYFHPLWDRWTQ